MNRIAPGYYTNANLSTTLDGQLVIAQAEVVRVEGHRAWEVQLYTYGGLKLLNGDDWYSTKAEAMAALNDLLRVGFHRTQWGICPKKASN